MPGPLHILSHLLFIVPYNVAMITIIVILQMRKPRDRKGEQLAQSHAVRNDLNPSHVAPQSVFFTTALYF